MGVKKRYLVICLMLLMIFMGGVCAADTVSEDTISAGDDLNQTLTVDNHDESGKLAGGSDSESNDDSLKASDDQDTLSAAGDFASLKSQLSATSYEINIYGDYTATGGGTSQRPEIASSNHIIDGHGGTWDRTTAYTARIIEVDNGVSNLHFKNIIFKNGHGAKGGAILFGTNCKNIIFENCVFLNNFYTGATNANAGGGGAIYFNEGCTVSFKNTNFTGNYITSTGGPATFERVVDNGGGAIHFAGAANGIEFVNCNFDSNYNKMEDNHAKIYGGAIFYKGVANNNKFINCSFTNNYLDGYMSNGGENHEAQPHGAAVAFKGDVSGIYFENCDFEGNKGFTFNRAQNEDWKTAGGGGAICFFNNANGVTINNSAFDQNSMNISGVSVYAWGGAVSFLNKESTVSKNILILNSNFTNNWVYASNPINRTAGEKPVTSYGGALYFKNPQNNINIVGSNFDSNHAYLGQDGESMTGAVYFGGDSLSTINIKDTYFARNTADGRYAVINFLVPVSNCNFTNVTFEDNSGNTAPLYFGSTVASTNINDCKFLDNVNSENGGLGAGLYIYNAVSVTINGSTFMNNKAPNSIHGSALYINDGANAQVDNCTFKGNEIAGNGAAIFWNARNDFITHNSYFIDNQAHSGSTVYFNRAPNSISFIDTEFINNEVTSDNGGALEIPSGTSTLNIFSSTFDGNAASNSGMAIYIPSSSMTVNINNSKFTNNNFVTGNGGAIYSGTTGKFTIIDSNFTDNIAQKGATIYFSNAPNSITIKGSNFVNNEVTNDDGGALNIPNGVTTTSINNCTFTNNIASGNGGAIYVNAGNTAINDSKFNINTAHGTANAIYVNDGRTGNSIYNSDFTGSELIYISEGAEASLTKNTELSTDTSEYIVKNYKGTLKLSGNNFNNVIINQGTITTQTYANISGNKTYEEDDYFFPINASITDDNENTIVSYAFQYLTNYNDIYDAADNETHNAIMRTSYELYYVGGKDTGLTNLKVYNATIKVYPKLGSYTWLQDKIDKLSAGDVYELPINITFNPSYDLSVYNRYYGIINFTEGMLINKALTLQGNGNTINGLNQARIFQITASNVKLYNTHFINATSSSNGGAFYIAKGVNDLTISDCTFRNDKASGLGGAIYDEGNANNIKIENTLFDSNYAGNGGAIQFYSNGPSEPYNRIDIIKCNFTNNRATLNDAYGGSAIGINQATNVNVFKSNFDKNIATSNGAVMLDWCSQVVFNACNFTNNDASKYGGAIYVKNGNAGSKTRIQNSRFFNNSAQSAGAIDSYTQSSFEITGSQFTANNANGEAGAIWINGNDNVISNCNFTNNTAGTDYGAVYYVGNNIISDCIFTGNNATGNVGAMYYNPTFNDATVSNLKFIKNHADGDVGALQMVATGHEINGITLQNFEFIANDADGKYGALALNQIEGGVESSKFINNTAREVSALFLTGNTQNINNCLFEGNNATRYGAVYLDSLNAKVTKSTFTKNNGGEGAGLWSDKNNVEISNSQFTLNQATGNGGAVYMKGDSDRIIDSNFTNNKASGNGGALMSDVHSLYVSGSIFESNVANEGGAIYAADTCNIIKSTFAKNNATNGAAIVFVNDFNITRSDFMDNYATGNGAVYVKKIHNNCTIDDSIFHRNHAGQNGGAIYYGDIEQWVPILKISDSDFINNTASWNGGAVYYMFTQGLVYRDYGNFDGRGITSLGRTTVEFIGQYGGNYGNQIYNCLFNNNLDYLFKVNATAPNATAEIRVYVPTDVDKRSSKLVINVIWFNGNVTTKVIDRSNFDEHFNYRLGVFYVEFENLPEGRNYTVNVTFEDDNHMKKNASEKFKTGTGRMGQFQLLQMLINQAIEDAKNNGRAFAELNLTRGFSWDDDLDEHQMYIDYPIILDLDGFTINAEGHCRIFNITADNVTLKNIQFLNGNVHGDHSDNISVGGAIYWCGANGTIIGSTFINNTAEYGGAVFFNSTAKDAKVINTIFERNNATHNGGAIDWNSTNGKLTDSIFEANTAQYGGALFCGINSEMGTSYNNVFIQNHAEINGGAIDLNATGANIELSKFYNNTAGQNGGAIFVGASGGSGKITKSIFEGNRADKETGRGGAVDWFAAGEIFDSSFTNNTAGYGGAVFIGKNGGYGNITNCNFTSNHAKHNGGGVDWNASSGTLTNSIFKYNDADYGGGAFRGSEARYGAGSGNIFIGNHARINGGAIDWNATNGFVDNYKFYNNTAGQNGGAVFVGANGGNGKIINSYFEGNNATGRGGAVDWYASTGDIENTEFNYNTADYGGAVFVGARSENGTIKNSKFNYNHANINGGAIDWNATSGNVTDSVFNHNTAGNNGGAVFVGASGESGKILNSNFTYNVADNRGGAIDWYASSGDVENSIFEYNHADFGGAIFVGHQTQGGKIINSTFSYNTADENGGAIDWNASMGNVSDSKFFDNNAGYGGAIFVGKETEGGVILNSEFTRNNAIRGGAIDWNATKGAIYDSNFTQNTADYGGALYIGNAGKHSQISRVIFDGNIARFNGGAIDCNATEANLTHTIFKNNRADYGAALCRESDATGGFGINNTFISNHAYTAGAALAWMGSVGIKINNYSFIDNTAGVRGGAIFINEGSDNCVIFNSTFDGNHITNLTENHDGGAIACLANNAVINLSTFNNNRAYNGGAIYVASMSGNTQIIDSNFTNNRASENGGAIGLRSSVSVNQSNFMDNTAHNGGAIYVGGEDHYNSIYASNFTNNIAEHGYGGAIDWVASSGDIFYSNFHDNSADYGGALYIGGKASESKISHVVFENNVATYNGGAMDSNATQVNLTHTVFNSNYAQYGAALCRESGATGGFGVDNNFTNNHAYIGGAALAWMNVSDIKIDNYRFINNTADVHGGAILVLEGSDNCKVYNSYFESNTVPRGHGGAIDWVGKYGEIINSTFVDNSAMNAGAILVCDFADNMKIINSSFTSNRATSSNGGAIEVWGPNAVITSSNFTSSEAHDKGGAIAGFNVHNITISDLIIKFSEVSGFHDPDGTVHGEGGAIYLQNSNGLNITRITLYDNEAHLQGGSIALINCSDSALSDMSIDVSSSQTYGGAIYWVDSQNATINNVTFNNCKATTTGGTIYFANVTATVKDSKFNNTKSSWNAGGAIYANGNITIINATFTNVDTSNHLGTAILFDGGNSSLIESSIDAVNPIIINNGTGVHLDKVNVTNSSSGTYSVWNDGDLWLNKNTFDNYIYNNGTIWTKTTTSILNNDTWEREWNTTFDFWANITDDNNNSIISVSSLMSNNTEHVGDSQYPMPYNKVTQRLIYQGVFHIYGIDEGLKDNTVKPGTLKVKVPTNIKFNITGVEIGDHVVIKATLYPETANYTIKGNVTFKVNGKEFSRKIIEGIATLDLYNLTADTYMVTAKYNGSDYYYGSENNTYFIIKLRDSWIKVVVNDITYGQIAIANVTTNANGTVLFYIKGKNVTKEIVNGNILFNITEFLGDLEPGDWSIGVIYRGNEYYQYAINQTNFTVYKLNTTITATPTNITFGENENITVDVHENLTGYIKITINNQEYVAEIKDGQAKFSIEGLAPKDYKDIEVICYGNQYINGNTTRINFTVAPATDFVMNVTADNIEYGKNATVRVLLPTLADGNVTITIDGTYRGMVPVVNGEAVLRNIEGLEGGKHYVNASYSGGVYYASKNVTDVEFNVTPTNDWKMTITVDEHPYGENTTITVKTSPYNVANKNLTIIIDEVPYTVNITGGVATLTLNNLTTGLHGATANYAGDANYSAKVQIFRLHITKAQPTVNLTIGEDNVVTANITGKNITGNVTFHINGRNYTVNVTDNIARLTNLTIGDNNIVAIYNGDANHFSASSAENYELERLESNVNVTVRDTEYGKTVEITVEVGENQTGFVKIIVNDEIYISELNGTTAKFNVTGLDVKEYLVNVTYYGDESFNASKNSTTFKVTKANVDADVIAKNVTVDQNTAFVIDRINSDFNGNVSITVDGVVMYNGTLKTLINGYTINVAGNKTAIVKFYAADNYNDTTLKVNFTVSKVTPAIDVAINDVVYPSNASALVLISNANGTVEIYLNNTLIGSGAITNGRAIINLTRLSAGAKEVTVKYISNDDYHNNANTTVKFNVIKAQSAIDIIQNGTDVIAVLDPALNGSVTFYINGVKYENVTVNGNATIKGKLQIGNNSVFVVYNGNENYTGSNNVKQINIAKHNATVNVTTSPIYVDGVARINITGPADITGYVIVTVNGMNYSVKLNNGVGHLDISGLGNGTYDVNVTYLENALYNTTTNSTKMVVSKLNTTVTVEVANITYGGVAQVIVTVPGVEFGFIDVTVNNTSKRLVIVNGKAYWNLTGLAVGKYNVTAKFDGNYKYNATLNTTVFKVDQAVPQIIVIVNNIEADHNATITVYINSTATGKIFVKVNGTEYNGTIENGKVVIVTKKLPIGVYPVNVTYEGDRNYTSAVDNTQKITVTEGADYVLNITVDDVIVENNVTINVHVPLDATGNVTIYIGKDKYNATIDHGVATLSVNITKEGLYLVNATYSSTKYAEKTVNAAFRAFKTYVPISIDVNDTVVGNVTKVIVTVPSDVDYNVTVEIDGKVYNATARNGKAEFNISGLVAGNKTITAIYAGDNKYVFNATTANFTVTKVKSSIDGSLVNVTVDDIAVGKVARINVAAPKDYNGTVVVEVDGVKYYVNMTDGRGYVDVAKLSNGTYRVNATLLENDKYESSYNDTVSFNVYKLNTTVTIEVANITYGGVAQIVITVGDVSLGNVTVTVNNTSRVLPLLNGKAYWNITDLAAGNYTVTASFAGNYKYNATSASKGLEVKKATPVITVVVNPVQAGHSANITVYINGTATGNITVKVNGTEYNRTIVNGKVEIVTKALPAGVHKINVTYYGDNNYTYYNDNGTGEASKVLNVTEDVDYNMTILIKEVDITVEDNVTIVVFVPVNATGNVTIHVGKDIVREVPIIGNNATLSLNITSEGLYLVNATYGNAQYANKTVYAAFRAFKTSIPIGIEVNDTVVGNATKVIVTVPGDADYNVTIEIDGKVYTPVSVTDGKAVFDVAGLTAGNKTVTVVYAGDNKYFYNATTANFTVSKVKSEIDGSLINVSVEDAYVDQTVRINVTGPSDLNGTVVVEVDGVKYYVNMTNGLGHVDIEKLANGTYTVNATLLETDKYESSYNDTERFTVSKWNSTLEVEFNNITLGEGVEFIITIGGDGAYGNVTIMINNTPYIRAVEEGSNIIVIPKLAVGTYDVTVTYNGNYKYLENTSSVMKLKVDPANMTEGLTVDDLGNKTVVVTVPDNATGNITLTIGTHKYTANITEGKAFINLVNETPGAYMAHVYYSGDSNHTNMTKDKVVHIPKYSTPITISVGNIYVDGVATITVTVPENVTKVVTIEIDGRTISKTANGGLATFEVTGLTAGAKTVTAIYAGDNSYVFNSTTKTFNVYKHASSVNVNTSDVKVDEIVVINITAPNYYYGHAIVNINGTEYSVNITNGHAQLNVTGLANGTYLINVTYLENDKYHSSYNDTVNFTVSKWNSTMDVAFENITVGDNVKLIITVPDDAYGNVTINIENMAPITVAVMAGENVIYVPKVAVGQYNVTVTYNGNYKYLSNASEVMKLKVSPLNTTEDDIIIDDNGNGTVIIKVGDNATGNVTVTINNETKVINLTNGSAIVNLTEFNNTVPGVNNITIIYSGDENHTGITVNSTVTVPKWDSSINATSTDIIEGLDEIITINVTPVNATGIVLVDINGTGYYANITKDGKVDLIVKGLKAGNYTAIVKYMGNDYYNGALTTTSFKVKDAISIDINGTGNSTVIVIHVPGNETGGNVTVYINGTNYTANVTNGTAVINLTNVTPGEHNVTIVYVDKNGTSTEINGTLTIPKWDAKVNATAINIIEGYDEIITINVAPINATGIVLVNINGTGYYVNVTDGIAKLTVKGLKAGNYTAKLIYLGNKYYNEATANVTFTVGEGIKIDVNGTGNSSVVVIKVPGNNTNGTITIVINGTNYTGKVINGTAIVNLTNVTPGEHNATIIYNDGNNNTSEFNTTITVPKWDSKINATAVNIREGDVEYIKVEITSGATGLVTVEIDGKGYFVNLTGTNKGQIVVPALKEGNYTNVKVTYVGDDKYLPSYTNVTFRVTAPIKIEIDGTGNSTNITVVVPGNETGGNITVIVDNRTIGTANITNGTGTVDLGNLTPGEHNVTVIYVDGNGTESVVNKTIVVPKWDSKVNATAVNIREGDVEYIKVEITSGATGLVTVEIDGKGYFVNLTDSNKGVIVVPALKEGNYTNIKVTYVGDDKYLPSYTNVTFRVTAPIKIEIDGTGNSTNITVVIPGNETGGNITVIVDNRTIGTANITNGTGTVDLGNLTPGEHNVTIIYVDRNGTETVVNQTITVPKWDSKVNATAVNIREGDDETITIIVTPDKATGRVLVDIAGKGYYANITGGQAKVVVSGLKEGDYTAYVTYLGDDKYNNATTTAGFKVSAAIKIEIDGTGNSTNITIVVPGNETAGNVTVIVDNRTIGTVNITNGTGTVDLGNLTPGEHNITVIYVDGNGTESVVNKTIVVPKWDSKVNATAVNIREGDIEYIKVEITSGATGLVTVEIDGKGYFVNLTGTNKGQIVIPALKEGNYTNIKVTYVGDDKYLPSSTNVTFKVTAPIKIEIDGTGNSTNITVVIPGNETGGNITVIVDNRTIGTANITNGTGTVDLGNLTPGEHNITVIYVDGNGTETVVNQTITVPKWDSMVNATAVNIREGDDETITIVVTPDVATGRVLVDIGGKGYYANITKGQAKVVVSGLKEGDYTAYVTYLGDDKYNNATTTVTFKVTAPIKIEIDGTGNSTNITVVVPGNESAGNVTVIVDNRTIGTVNITNGTGTVDLGNLTPGEHNITVIYVDGNGTVSVVNQTITVPKWTAEVNATVVNIREGDVEYIKVEITSGATGLVVVEIDGKGYFVNLTSTNKGEIAIPALKQGDYNDITVTYLGDDKYNNASTTVTFKVTAPIKIEIDGTGNSTNITVVVPGNESAGNVTVIVDNRTIGTVNITNGTGTVDLGNLTPGEHNITVIYVDGNGTVSVVNQTITVPKWTAEINATAVNIREGDIEYIKVEITSGATGLVVVEIDGKGYFVNLTSTNKGKIAIPALKEGDYNNVIVTYLGDDKYNNASTTVTFKVSAAIKIEIDGTGNSTNITVVVPGNETGGNITVIVDNRTIGTANITNGTGSVDLGNLTPGEHNVTVIYVDGNGTVSVVNQTITVPKWDSKVNATAVNIREGDDETITITVTPDKATGRVLVDIDGKGYYANITDGQAKVVVSGLKENTYTAHVTYLGDDKYNNSTTDVEFKVSAPIKIDIDGTGNSTNVTVVVPGNETGGNITVIVDNKTIGTANITNGTGTVDLGNLTPGEHNITVIYVDGNGTVSVVNQTITVPKWDSKVNATAVNITEGEEEEITITVTPDKTSGLVLVDIKGKGYYANVTNGQAKVVVAGLKAGTYTAYVTYLGDDKYNNSTTTVDFKVSINPESSVEVTGNESDVQVKVDLPEDATGNITVKVGNETKVIPAKGGENVITISNVSSGQKEVNVTYSGDDNYDSFSVVKTVYVGSTINAKDKLVRGYNSEFDYEAEFLDSEGHVLINTDVQFVVNGKTYTVKTDEKGVARLQAKLAVGNYEVTSINPVTGQKVVKNLTIVKRIVENKDVTMDFDDGTYVVVRAIDDDGTPVGAGEVVSLKVNGISYVGVTNDKGYAKVKINLNPKKYTMTFQYRGYKTTSKLVVKQTMKLVKKTVKVKKGKKIVLKAKVKLSNGKAVKGKVIKFKFKGKYYKAKTNKKGIAKVTIKKKSVLKKLKKGKKYKYTAIYNKNKVSGKVKIKK